MLMAVMLKDALPVLARAMTSGELGVPTGSVEKFLRLGYGVRNGPFTPVPVREIVSGLIRVLSARLMAPD